MKKNILTFGFDSEYAESLKTNPTASAPRQRVFFMPVILWGMRAGNIQYQPKLFGLAFSESPANSFFGGLLRKIQRMKKSAETTLQTLYRYYSEMKQVWYKGAYTNDQEDIYSDVFFALERALIKLPAQSKADRKVKLQMLKNMVEYTLETKDGIDYSLANGMELESLELINQLGA